MAKSPANELTDKDAKRKASKRSSKKEKEKKPLVVRVKKVINKSRRKLSEENFEKELQRTITFLEEIQAKMNETPAKEKAAKKPRAGKVRKTKAAESAA